MFALKNHNECFDYKACVEQILEFTKDCSDDWILFCKISEVGGYASIQESAPLKE
jgi:hypothetical protein